PEATRAIRGTERIRRRRLMVSALGFILWDLRRDFHKNKRTRSAFAPFDKQWNCASDQLREVDKAVEAAYTDAPIFKDLSTEQWISNRSGVKNPHERRLQDTIQEMEHLLGLLLRAFDVHTLALSDARRKAGQASGKARRALHDAIRKAAEKLRK